MAVSQLSTILLQRSVEILGVHKLGMECDIILSVAAMQQNLKKKKTK